MQVQRFDLDGQGRIRAARQLTTGSSTKANPTLAPDGSRVAYIRQEQDGRSDLFTISIDGGQERRVASTVGPKMGVSWSPDGRWLAYMSTGDSATAIHIVGAEGGTEERVGRSAPSPSGGSPVWSPDGKHLLYHLPSNRNFMVLDLGTGEEQPLVRNDSVGWIFSPVFSPAGDRVVAYWHRPPRRDLWVIGLQDGSQIRLPDTDNAGMPIIWANDGSVYFEENEDVGTGIMRWDPRSRRSTLVTRPTAPCTPTYTTMSKDGRLLVCVSLTQTSDIWLSELPRP